MNNAPASTNEAQTNGVNLIFKFQSGGAGDMELHPSYDYEM